MTTGPESSIQLPRGSTRITRGGIAVEIRVLGMRALSAAISRSSPTSSFFWSGDGFLMAAAAARRCWSRRRASDCSGVGNRVGSWAPTAVSFTSAKKAARL